MAAASDDVCLPEAAGALVTSFNVLPWKMEEPFRRALVMAAKPEAGGLSFVLELSDLESSQRFLKRCGGIALSRKFEIENYIRRLTPPE